MPHRNAWQPVCGELVYFGDLAYAGKQVPGFTVPQPVPTKFTLPSYSIDMTGKSTRKSADARPVPAPAPPPKRPHLRLV